MASNLARWLPCCGANLGPKSEEMEQSRLIDRQLIQDSNSSKRTLNVLLLGAGESGKSTTIKQMRLKYEKCFSREESIGYASVLCSNLVQSVLSCLDAMAALELNFANEEEKKAAALVAEIDVYNIKLDPSIVEAIGIICNSNVLAVCLQRSTEFQLNDSAPWYFANWHRICAPDFQPATDDILRARTQTTGIIEHRFFVEDRSLKVLDVGGQRSERRKWLACFDNVSVLLYLFATSEFDQKLREDTSIRRFDEAISLWESITNSRYFSKSTQIVFLNKCDILKQKLENKQFDDYVPEYDGENRLLPVLRYMTDRLLSLNRDPKIRITAHTTTATHTKSIDSILSTVQQQILTQRIMDAFDYSA